MWCQMPHLIGTPDIIFWSSTCRAQEIVKYLGYEEQEVISLFDQYITLTVFYGRFPIPPPPPPPFPDLPQGL